MRSFKLIFVCLLALGLVFLASNSFARVTLVYGTTEKVTDMDPANAFPVLYLRLHNRQACITRIGNIGHQYGRAEFYCFLSHRSCISKNRI